MIHLKIKTKKISFFFSYKDFTFMTQEKKKKVLCTMFWGANTFLHTQKTLEPFMKDPRVPQF